MKHDTLAKQRREDLLEQWVREGRVKLSHTPIIDYRFGVKVTTPKPAVQVGEHRFEDDKDLYPSESLIARIALAIEAGQAPLPNTDQWYGGAGGSATGLGGGATGPGGATGIIGGSIMQGNHDYRTVRKVRA